MWLSHSLNKKTIYGVTSLASVPTKDNQHVDAAAKNHRLCANPKVLYGTLGA
jgi:hypothetical protein